MDIEHVALRAWVTYEAARVQAWDRVVKDESGEGVISAAIAVLVMSFLGALMWFGFKILFDNADTKITDNVNKIGT